MILVLLSGLPASGKTTLTNKFINKGTIISPDNYIGYTEDNPWTPQITKYAWDKSDQLFNEALRRGDNLIIFDATFVGVKKRRKYINIGQKEGARIICICCYASKETILKRNSEREIFRRVPHFVINNMSNSFVFPEKNEGFDYVVKYNSEKDEFIGDVIKVKELLEVI